MEFLLILCTGLLVGFLVPMPPGAIAVICIQRTLCKNRKSGFTSGLGAASANAVSATIAAFFLGIFLPFIEKNADILKVICGICIMILGISVFTKNPVIQMRKNSVRYQNLWSDFISVFIIAIINPAFILTFMAFFAFFNVSEITYLQGVGLIGGVYTGASLWWFLLTLGINTFRKEFRPRYMRYMNMASGALIVVLGLIVALSGIFGSQ